MYLLKKKGHITLMKRKITKNKLNIEVSQR